MLRTLNQNTKAAGEMAVREMSAKAQRGYNETDPMVVYKTSRGFYIEDCVGCYGPMSFEECESNLEDWAD